MFAARVDAIDADVRFVDAQKRKEELKRRAMSPTRTSSTSSAPVAAVPVGRVRQAILDAERKRKEAASPSPHQAWT
jgi:hypothetical protein